MTAPATPNAEAAVLELAKTAASDRHVRAFQRRREVLAALPER